MKLSFIRKICLVGIGINIPLVGSFADTSEGEFMTQLELVTSSWTYKFDKKNNNIFYYRSIY